jgi:molecular chaperone DnaK (HSP70)|mmetsp:Transcript_14886/g.20161  ORF Transcript_14886/g.20161 Transcript_14886/m.20161 type:complete len:206 (+) Transcript_14886:999-1616(+)|eukprot:CAMPEP_0185577984 /NCGR_PEP_ID=MMETSP0434-20130131/11633_1 /TAXON_ID=626734 ORGANISM="Favella taraikaensis, Strain Fe Narragansett Bay" /NCGR_SAMPLE_ID=MMETSP0434 /ASSEMBLY_ACC=CAM_ASM_000379 /LENGTH=205 /DNA_ID=CAMNT_0028195689 /DNA_START=972 /DNA_END=1589 /DNA_ORIENTATION=+
MTDALKDAGVDKDEIDEVVLVGGSTLIPKVRSMIKDFFSNEDILNLDLDPDEAVAVGATLQAGILAGQDRDGQQTIVKNCIPLSIGIKLASGDMSVIIKRNTRIPIEAGKMYYTAYTNQNEISINVKQGEAKIADSNHSLGTFYLRGIPDGPAGSQKVHVNFRIDSDCTLHVTMKTMHNNEEIEKIIKPQDHFALTEEEVTQMIV